MKYIHFLILKGISPWSVRLSVWLYLEPHSWRPQIKASQKYSGFGSKISGKK